MNCPHCQQPSLETTCPNCATNIAHEWPSVRAIGGYTISALTERGPSGTHFAVTRNARTYSMLELFPEGSRRDDNDHIKPPANPTAPWNEVLERAQQRADVLKSLPCTWLPNIYERFQTNNTLYVISGPPAGKPISHHGFRTTIGLSPGAARTLAIQLCDIQTELEAAGLNNIELHSDHIRMGEHGPQLDLQSLFQTPKPFANINSTLNILCQTVITASQTQGPFENKWFGQTLQKAKKQTTLGRYPTPEALKTALTGPSATTLSGTADKISDHHILNVGLVLCTLDLGLTSCFAILSQGSQTPMLEGAIRSIKHLSPYVYWAMLGLGVTGIARSLFRLGIETNPGEKPFHCSSIIYATCIVLCAFAFGAIQWT